MSKALWNRLLMVTKDALSIILSLAALLTIAVIWGNLPTRMATAEVEIKTLNEFREQTQTSIAVMKNNTDYLVKTLTELKDDLKGASHGR